MPPPALDADALEARLDEALDAALSSRRTAAGPARALADRSRIEQDFALRWIAVIGRDNSELAYQFAARAADAMRLMDLDAVQSWLLHAMELYDKQGQTPALRALREVADFAARRRARLAGVMLAETAAMLERFVVGLNGRALTIAAGEQCHTDTERIFLPSFISHCATREANVHLYKALTAHQWAQNWYGTWRAGRLLEAIDNGTLPAADWPLFHAIETLRLDACLARDLPGLHRDMAALRERLDGAAPAWTRQLDVLNQPTAGVVDSLRLTQRLRDQPLFGCCYRGTLDPEAVRVTSHARAARERERLRVALARLIEDRAGAPPDPAPEAGAAIPAMRADLSVRPQAAADAPDGVRYDLLLDGQPLAPPADVVAIMASIIQDHGEIPPDYLVPAGPGPYRRDADATTKDSDSAWTGTYHEDGAFLYDEWDFSREHYRRDWCVLREHEMADGEIGFYLETLRRHAGLIKSIRRAFEALRGEDRLLKRQIEGDGIDIDALVEAHADRRAGREGSERLFTRARRHERSIAVMLMADMSGSTMGWINQVEREALILLAEALVILGDRFAIHGFSGWTRKRCETFVVKRFDEPYDERIKGRIGAIAPRDYTRMGAPIRHLGRLLCAQPARARLLIVLSDGKPDDYDPLYRGDYGIEDTRQALFEVRAGGVQPYCITIDEQGADYLPRLYGAANYSIIADVARLPARLSDIYRKLTS